MEFYNPSHSASASAALMEAEPSPVHGGSLLFKSSSRVGKQRRFWICLAVIATLATVGLSPSLLSLWEVWTDDPLRSIGMLIVPASVILTLRVWRQFEWELKGTWWGVLPLALAFAMSNFRLKFAWLLVIGQIRFNLFAPKLALYCFGSGIILLFAGTRVWRRAWFPLALLLCAQPVPMLGSRYLDLPLQTMSAQIARAFAVRIGFAPTNPELLRLMFTPDFGMFIAPGCDGLRGAVTLGYSAMILGYLKRVSIWRWISYVIGAVLLGYFLNLIRLCALVLYYRVALGHHLLEHFAKQADYIIGGCLILIAAVLFLRIVTRQKGKGDDTKEVQIPQANVSALPESAIYWRAGVFVILALIFVVPGALALKHYQKSFAATIRDGELKPAQLDDLMPKEVGEFKLSRAWQENSNGKVMVESAAYRKADNDEVVLGVWIRPSQHTMHESWSVRGESPELRGNSSFITANGRPVLFDTAYYSDGITDTFAGNVFCKPSSCLATNREDGSLMEFRVDPVDFKTRGVRAVSIFFRVERPHGIQQKADAHRELVEVAQQFLANFDFSELSQRFQ